jgi:hypothetical protein
MNALQPLSRGISHEEFRKRITSTPKSEFPIENKGVAYSVEVFSMQTGTNTVVTPQYVWNKYGGYTMMVTRIVPVYADYFFIFDKTGLLYWGFMNELQKADDELVNQLASLISSKYNGKSSPKK